MQDKLTKLLKEINVKEEILEFFDNASIEKVIMNLENGEAYNKFLELIKTQKGNIHELSKTNNKYEIKSNTEGYIVNMDAHKLGTLSMSLGAGRQNKEDTLDYSAGVIVHKEISDYVKKGDVIMTLYTNKEITKIDNSIFKISKDRINKQKLIIDILK